MKRLAAFLIAISAAQVSHESIAGNACVELFRHSLYDELVTTSSSLSYRAYRDKFCKSSDVDTANKQEADTGASYGFISGYGNFSNEEKKKIKEAVCDDTQSTNLIVSNQQLFSKTLDPNALKAAVSCISAEKSGLNFDFEEDSDDQFTAKLAFTPSPGDSSKYRLITDPNRVSETLSCKGQLADVKKGTRIENSFISMTCQRKALQSTANNQASESAFLDNGGTVIISTASGTLKASLSKKPNPKYQPAAPKPVDISGRWASRGNESLVAQIASAGNGNLVFTNEFGSKVDGKRNDENNIEVTGAWGHLSGRFLNHGQVLLWTNGSYWSRSDLKNIPGEKSKLPLADNWTYAGMRTIVRGSPDAPIFINEKGEGSQGKLVDPTDIRGYGLSAKLIDGGSVILWSNGTFWSR
jgi:hypothetical protein